MKGLFLISFSRVFCLFILFLFITSENLTLANPLGEEEYLAFAQKMPEPVGGLETIIKKIVYPSLAKQQNIQGKVYLLVYVNEKGTVDDVKVVRGLGMGCDDAAIDAVKKSKFTPGQDKGQNVKVKLSIAITFKLS